jgi:hypothetical protein
MINALTGRNLARTSQEACTGNICYFYNKPFDDNRIHFSAGKTDYCFIDDREKEYDWTETVAYALPFKTVDALEKRICVIDTPGVNTVICREFGSITRKCIQEEKFECLYYIFNANKLGTEEDIAYLKWISKNVPHEKIVFVLNKLDDFRASEDSIESSIEGIQNDLKNLGYERPVLFPVSSYYAYLIKKKMQGIILSEEEEDEYTLFSKKYSKKAYDLSGYYEDGRRPGEQLVEQLKRCGFYYLEKNICGGAL